MKYYMDVTNNRPWIKRLHPLFRLIAFLYLPFYLILYPAGLLWEHRDEYIRGAFDVVKVIFLPWYDRSKKKSNEK